MGPRGVTITFQFLRGFPLGIVVGYIVMAYHASTQRLSEVWHGWG